MTSLPQYVDVLIVGAGPSGLAAGLALQKEGCTKMLIVDNVMASEHTSRALTVHSATMQALDKVGCAEPLVELGIQSTGGRLWDGYRFHEMADYSVLKAHTKWPYVLLLPQHLTEKVLGERVHAAGIDVRRPFKVVDLQVNTGNANITDVIFEDGQVVQARYVVGADGPKSIVRQCAGIGYGDPDGEDGRSEELKQAVIGDVTFSSPPPIAPNQVLFVLTNGNFFLCLPLPPASYEGEHVWRMGTGIPIGVPPHAPDRAYLQGVLDAYGPGCISTAALPDRTPMKIEKVIWSTRFRTHSAIADTPFARLGGGTGGPVVLIGDAAHLHPPVGGQGMNLGLRDAVFLGPVLAEHLRMSYKEATTARRTDLDKPLEQWAAWRHAQGLKVIALAKRGLTFASWRDELTWWYGMVPVNWVSVRNAALWVLSFTGYGKRMIPWALSGLKNP